MSYQRNAKQPANYFSMGFRVHVASLVPGLVKVIITVLLLGCCLTIKKKKGERGQRAVTAFNPAYPVARSCCEHSSGPIRFYPLKAMMFREHTRTLNKTIRSLSMLLRFGCVVEFSMHGASSAWTATPLGPIGAPRLHAGPGGGLLRQPAKLGSAACAIWSSPAAGPASHSTAVRMPRLRHRRSTKLGLTGRAVAR
jgi:hypothetical protein